VKGGKKFATHLLPSGILTDKMVSVIGNGVVIHFPTLFHELEALDAGGISYKNPDGSMRLFISDRAHVVFEFHRGADSAGEVALGKSSLGTTGRGIGPSYAQKMERTGVRVHHLFEPDFADTYNKALALWLQRFPNLEALVEGKGVKYPDYGPVEIKHYLEVMKAKIAPFVIDSAEYFDHQFQTGSKKLLIESANAIMLDIDHGTYPYVTSSSPSVGGACSGLGIPVNKLGSALVCGIVKAYTTRVGSGPFPTELPIDKEGEAGFVFSTVGREVGTTTGRKRRCGWLDLAVVRYGARINGYTCLNLTKLDVLDTLDEVKVCTHYTLDGKQLSTVPASLSDLARVQCHYVTLPGWKQSIEAARTFSELPANAQKYIQFIQDNLKIHVRWIGVGPGSDAMVEVLPK